ncbi:MAG: hypothetical protein ACRC1R_01100 [Cetobacterium sp.]|uniref:hypothetical protein n=1 Tax=Cetobacterium sp. TaxID=2071632 RepID=UPI003F371805
MLEKLPKNKIRILSLILSLVLTFIELSINKNYLEISGNIFAKGIFLLCSFYLIIYPCCFYLRSKFFIFLNKHIFLIMFMTLYFTSLIPILGEIHKVFFNGSDFLIIKILHIFIIIISILLILVCISRQFILIIFNRRKIQGLDIVMTFSIYLILGFAFGSIYYLLNYEAPYNLFSGVLKPSIFNFEVYLTYIYISLGYLSTVGSGSISPLSLIVRLLTVSETIIGISMTSFSLGFIFAVMGSNISKKSKKLPNNENLNFILVLKKSSLILREQLKKLEKDI